MKKNTIKKLAEQSFTRKKLDSNKIELIESKLKREDLKVYIKELKTIEAKKTLLVTLPSEEGLGEVKKQLSNLYPDKEIVFEVDPSLIAGIRIQDQDNLFELSLKGFLEGALRRTND